MLVWKCFWDAHREFLYEGPRRLSIYKALLWRSCEILFGVLVWGSGTKSVRHHCRYRSMHPWSLPTRSSVASLGNVGRWAVAVAAVKNLKTKCHNAQPRGKYPHSLTHPQSAGCLVPPRTTICWVPIQYPRTQPGARQHLRPTQEGRGLNGRLCT